MISLLRGDKIMETIILAGGKSSRMGTNKALLKIGEQRIIDRLVSEFSLVSNHVMLVTNQPEEYKGLNVAIISDESKFKGQGPLAGIYSGLKEARTNHCLVIACDMPFAKKCLGIWLIEQLKNGDYDAVIPSYHGRLHPLFGAYHSRIMEAIKGNLLAGKRKMTDLLNDINVRIIECQDAPLNLQNEWEDNLWNMNTVEDYKQALKIADMNQR